MADKKKYPIGYDLSGIDKYAKEELGKTLPIGPVVEAAIQRAERTRRIIDMLTELGKEDGRKKVERENKR